MTMKKRTVAAVASATLGLTLLGAGAASASTDTNPVEWAQRMAQQAGFRHGADDTTVNRNGTGDPTTCPYNDGTTEAVQQRTRQQLQDPDAAQATSPQQERARIHVAVDE